MSDDQFTKLFKYMQTGLTAVRSDIGGVDKKIDAVQNTLDSFAKQLLDMNQEHLMLARKVDRVEAWFSKLRKKQA